MSEFSADDFAGGGELHIGVENDLFGRFQGTQQCAKGGYEVGCDLIGGYDNDKFFAPFFALAGCGIEIDVGGKAGCYKFLNFLGGDLYSAGIDDIVIAADP